MQRLLLRAQTGGRTDDSEDTIRKRQKIYAEETAPLVDEYGHRGLLVRVDGLGEVSHVTERLVQALDARR
ncbi:hypothetical protein GCM10025868_32990 [Angustibacter aerolatus]|uniref:Adenylate kinase n=1 Tax=Angustibacter aerolatus TaxID=1162965 RepID=A0ABQ6JJI9_9ACTN|nr:hypothetical protein GCM10025868_32990 [Angustibacter aerolatus]